MWVSKGSNGKVAVLCYPVRHCLKTPCYQANIFWWRDLHLFSYRCFSVYIEGALEEDKLDTDFISWRTIVS